MTQPALLNIINGKSVITPCMAIRISEVFGGNATFWVRLQTAYDLREVS
ncbi:HigA family addiction module antidote protein (plasmid) [Chryseobacterium panacisoli]|uniref:HigA family addiction module antidote protein n=1 Tax=Chryseobacterium panacisoli TaxID=1807141 RepID=A0A5D9A001_9FLAO|nr:HigA family addiction module antidote protein [Chryseobacterium panacisoli]